MPMLMPASANSTFGRRDEGTSQLTAAWNATSEQSQSRVERPSGLISEARSARTKLPDNNGSATQAVVESRSRRARKNVTTTMPTLIAHIT